MAQEPEEQEEYYPNYMDALFKQYIKHTLGALPKDKYEGLNELKLYRTFKMPECDWKEVIAKVLNLSETIDIAIWDLWIKFEKRGYDYSVGEFAEDFIVHYYKDESKIDVWRDNEQLEMAKQRIEEYKNAH